MNKRNLSSTSVTHLTGSRKIHLGSKELSTILKTKEAISQIDTEAGELYKDNFDIVYFNMSPILVFTLSNTLTNSFSSWTTSQGGLYWSHIFNKLCDIEDQEMEHE